MIYDNQKNYVNTKLNQILIVATCIKTVQMKRTCEASPQFVKPLRVKLQWRRVTGVLN